MKKLKPHSSLNFGGTRNPKKRKKAKLKQEMWFNIYVQPSLHCLIQAYNLSWVMFQKNYLLVSTLSLFSHTKAKSLSMNLSPYNIYETMQINQNSQAVYIYHSFTYTKLVIIIFRIFLWKHMFLLFMLFYTWWRTWLQI